MTSQITKDFQMKSKLRKLADGGSPDPSVLGTGAAARAGGLLAGRGRQIDDAVDAAAGAPAPAPGPAPAPAPAPQQAAQPPKKSGLRSMLGLADGGSYLDDGYNANRYQQSQLKDGGRVKGPGGRTDDKVGPVMLSDEEYVLPGDTADAIGRDKLDAIRLATHEFEDERKKSTLRGRADGGDGWYDDMMPMDHLADGGNPWIVDSEGVARKANAFGDAAAGPGYQQPRLPPPQPGTAVGPSALSPGGHRTINMGMVDDVTPRPAQIANNPTASAAAKTAQPWTGAAPTNPNVGPAGSKEAQALYKAGADSAAQAASGAAKDPSLLPKAGSALRTTGSVLAKGAGVVGAGMAAKDMYDNGVNVGNSGDLLASGAAFAGPVGAAGAAGWGVGRAIGNNLGEDTRDLIGGTINQGVRNVGKFFGQDWGVDDSALLQQKAEARLSMANAPAAAAAAAPATSALRSDQGPALPVEPGSYQSRRLSEMGVPLDVQNSNPLSGDLSGPKTGGFSPVTQGRLATQGTAQYQNLGTYGGNGNIYGKADDPSRPGRINNFVGVGAGASPENEANGSGSGGYAGRGGVPQSSLRGSSTPSGGPSAPGGSNSGGGPTMSVIGGGNDWYDRARKDILTSGVSVGRMTQQLVELANIRAGRENNRDTNAQSGANARLTADTSRENAQLTADTSRENAELSARTNLEAAKSTLEGKARDAKAKAVADAISAMKGDAKAADARTGRALSDLNGYTERMFGKDTPEGRDFERAFRVTNPEFFTMSDAERAAMLPQVHEQLDAQRALRRRASKLGRPSGIGIADIDGAPRAIGFGDWANDRATFGDWMESHNFFGDNDKTAVHVPGSDMYVSRDALTKREDGSSRSEVAARLSRDARRRAEESKQNKQ